MSTDTRTLRRTALRRLLPTNGSRLVGLRVVVGEYRGLHWRLTRYDGFKDSFAVTSLTVPATAHSITFDDLRAGYAEGLIRLE